jgi:hypothetical protein
LIAADSDDLGERRAKMKLRLREGDEGLSLSEFMVATILLAIVLGGAYAVQFAVNRAVAINDPIASGAETLSGPAEFMNAILMQTHSVVSTGTVRDTATGATVTVPGEVAPMPGDYALAVATDRSYDGGGNNWELNYFHIDAATPSTLIWNGYTYNASDTIIASKTYSWQMSTTTGNRARGVPLFTYYNASGSVLSTATPGVIAGSLKSVKIRLNIANPDGTPMTDTRIATMRN